MEISKAPTTDRYVMPPEVEEIRKTIPKWGTPECKKWIDNAREKAWKNGMPKFNGDDVLKAMERERAGYNGLGELWGSVPMSTQM
jgi:hypothetical protein